jgi:hypothetical protein
MTGVDTMSYPGQQPPQWNPYGAPYGPGQYGPGQYGPGQYGPGQYGPGQWGPPPRNNIPAAVLLAVGGLAGVLQFFLPWIDTMGQSVNGMDIADAVGAASKFGSGSSNATLIQIGIFTVLIGGTLALFAGVALFVPMRDRKVLGALSLVLSIAMIVSAVFWLTAGTANPDSTSVGYYLFLGAGAIAMIGSIVALAKR